MQTKLLNDCFVAFLFIYELHPANEELFCRYMMVPSKFVVVNV